MRRVTLMVGRAECGVRPLRGASLVSHTRRPTRVFGLCKPCSRAAQVWASASSPQAFQKPRIPHEISTGNPPEMADPWNGC
eukprot:1981141-Prymnesium_polylepis.1